MQITLRVLQTKWAHLVSWYESRFSGPSRQLINRWVFVNVILCVVLLEVANALWFTYGWGVLLSVFALVQMAGLSYVRLSPLVFLATLLLNSLSLVLLGKISVFYALLSLHRLPDSIAHFGMVWGNW